MARQSNNTGSTDNSDRARYQRGVQAYASQFRIPPEQVAGWFADAVGDRFAGEAIQSAANAWTGDVLTLRERSLIVVAALIARETWRPSCACTPGGRWITAPQSPSWKNSPQCSRSTADSPGPPTVS
jgi:hypothetical protein